METEINISTPLLDLMHVTVNKVNNIKSLTELIKGGKLNPDEVKFSIDKIGELADKVNAELDNYYKVTTTRKI